MREIACDFAEEGRLKGILTLPEEESSSAITLVLISAGFTSKCGPYGLYSQLARQLAPHGFATFRFDLSGIADSQTLNSSLPLMERTKLDTRAAIDFLQAEYGMSEFVVGGLCSGAEDALRYAPDDKRIRGVMMVDPHAYRTIFWHVKNFFGRQMFNRIYLRSTKLFGFGAASRLRKREVPDNELSVELVDYPYMQRGEATQLVNMTLENGAHIHYIYTAGRSVKFNYSGQVRHMLPGVRFSERLTVDHLPEIEHTQAFPEDRDKLIGTIKSRMLTTYLNRAN